MCAESGRVAATQVVCPRQRRELIVAVGAGTKRRNTSTCSTATLANAKKSLEGTIAARPCEKRKNEHDRAREWLRELITLFGRAEQSRDTRRNM